MDKCYKYRLWCTTDSKWEYVISEDPDTAPTLCPTDTTHSIDVTKTSIDSTLLREVQKTQSIVAQDDMDSAPLGFNFSVPTGQTVSFDYKMPEILCIRGGVMETIDHGNTDEMDFVFIDKDDVLGWGENFIFGSYMNKWQSRIGGVNELKDESISPPIPKDTYARAIYTNSGPNTVIVKFNLYTYRKS